MNDGKISFLAPSFVNFLQSMQWWVRYFRRILGLARRLLLESSGVTAGDFRCSEQPCFRSVYCFDALQAKLPKRFCGVCSCLDPKMLSQGPDFDTWLWTAMITNWKAALARVKAVLMHRGRTRQEAEDLVQEAWLRLALYERDQKVNQPEAFLMRAALNLSIDEFRSGRHQFVHVPTEEQVLVDAAPAVEAILLGKERLARLTECLASLDPRTQQIFLAHRLNGTSYRDIAKEHGLSVSSVEKQIAKATLVLARFMEGW